MKKMKKTTQYLLLLLIICSTKNGFSQDSTTSKSLDEVVVTGQIKPQSLKSSVYQVKTINNQRIKLSGATNVQQVLNTQLGFRFSNDNALGVTDVQINGMSGRTVKILLDGVPLLDRFDQRTSLSQIDVNTIEKIEIVEGPMAVSFGSDAMAGTINIITKKQNRNTFSINARVQEETAGKEYHPFNFKGVHHQSLNLSTNKNNWNLQAGGAHNDFNGFGGNEFGREKTWLPKNQYFGNIKLGYTKNKWNVYYRLDAVNEKISDRNKLFIDTDFPAQATSKDQNFTSKRMMHQLQSSVQVNNKTSITSFAAFTNFSRATETFDKDFINNTSTLGKLDGEQDVSLLKSFSIKNTLQYEISNKIALQAGLDINTEKAAGQRIDGNPNINDVALFVSTEYKPTSKINIRPGVRLIKNSKYNAPPIVPAINTKFSLAKNLDLRLSYAVGFRAPALRELYFNFVDVNHNIVGNKNLKAETSNSLNGSLTYQVPNLKTIKLSSTVSAFYNAFKQQIVLEENKANLGQFSYFNIEASQTKGVSVENKLEVKNLLLMLGFNYNAYARQYDKGIYKNENRNFFWTPELNTNVTYNVKKINTTFGLFYKLIGTRPTFSYEQQESPIGLYVTNTSAYNLADFTATSIINKYLTINAGAKNIFDITDVNNNTIGNSNIAHNGEGPVSIGYGRSYFVGLSFQFYKK
jgi:outer membrane receptor for ferrienterochelin and colicins